MSNFCRHRQRLQYKCIYEYVQQKKRTKCAGRFLTAFIFCSNTLARFLSFVFRYSCTIASVNFAKSDIFIIIYFALLSFHNQSSNDALAAVTKKGMKWSWTTHTHVLFRYIRYVSCHATFNCATLTLSALEFRKRIAASCCCAQNKVFIAFIISILYKRYILWLIQKFIAKCIDWFIYYYAYYNKIQKTELLSSFYRSTSSIHLPKNQENRIVF